MEIGTRVLVNLEGFATARQNAWVHKYLKHGVSALMTGTIKRHADNGKTGIEFDEEILANLSEGSNTSTLHGAGKEGHCLYVAREFYTLSREDVRPQGDIAQSMEDTMLDHEYGMDEDEYMDIVGF
jgi:hypothetical protein